jgi:DNA-directed RNA polymerase specialized sigma24 family protein
VFVRAWERAGDWRGRSDYPAWLAGIGWKLFLDWNRRTRRRAQLWSLFGWRGADLVEPPQAGAAIDLERLLERLPADQRAVLLLCEGAGWSHAEVAAILGLPLGTVKSHVARAKARLRALTGEDDDHG